MARQKDDFIGFSATAKALGKSRTTIYRLMSEGLLTPHYRPKNPRSPVFPRSQVEALDIPGPKEPVMNLALHKEARKRDGRCVVCFRDGSHQSLTAHHVVPIEQGGTDSLDNLAALCTLCHAAVHGDGLGLKADALKNGTEAVTNWLRRSCGTPEIDFGDRRAA